MAKEYGSGKVSPGQSLVEHTHLKEKRRARKCRQRKCDKNQETEPEVFKNKGAVAVSNDVERTCTMKTNVIGFGDFKRAFL